MIFPNLDKQRRNNRIAIGIILAILLLGCLGVAGTCLIPPNPEAHVNRSMTEVETPAKEMGLTGTVLVEKDHDAIVAIDLATGSSKTVYQCAGRFQIWAIDGPNRNGVAVVIENDMTGKRHRVLRLNLTNQKSELMFDRPGDALWESAISDHVALAENRNLALLHVGTGHLQLYNPKAYMELGKLVLLDLDSKRETVIDSAAFSSCAEISPDADSIWLSKQLDRAKALSLPGGSRVKNGNGPVPGVFVWKSGISMPIASGCGFKSFLEVSKSWLYDTNAESLEWDHRTGEVSPVTTPDYVYTIQEWFRDGTLIAVAPQSDPNKVEFVGDNFSRGKQAKDRIVAIRPEKGQIHTIVPQLDSAYDKWSYGAWSATASSQSQP